MRTLGFLSLLLLPLSGVSVGTTEPEGFKFWSAATVSQATHDLVEPAASDPHHFAVRQLGDFPNEAVLWFIARRTARPSGMRPRWTSSMCSRVPPRFSSVAHWSTERPSHRTRNATARFREAFAKRLPRETGSASRRKRRISFSWKVRRNSITWS